MSMAAYLISKIANQHEIVRKMRKLCNKVSKEIFPHGKNQYLE